MKLKIFEFNHFSQNTLVLWDDTKEAVIIDPGCYFEEEKKSLSDFIRKETLVIKKVLYTHCHLDHAFGASYVASTFRNISFEAHEAEDFFIEKFAQFTASFGIKADQPPAITKHIQDGDTISFGDTKLVAIHVPGHSLGSICFYNQEDKLVITGDVLFRGSIGRSDFPGGNGEQLIGGIRNKLLALPDDTDVYPGHGAATTIGNERTSNPFLINC